MKESKGRTVTIVLRVVRVLVAVPILLLGVWGIILHAPFLAVVAILGSLVFLPVLERGRFIPKAKIGLAFLILASLAVSRFEPIREVNDRIAVLAAKEARVWTIRDRLSVWGLNVVMGVCGCIPFPEVSQETLLMTFPHRPSDTLIFKSDFALSSRKIRTMLRDFCRSLPEGSEGEIRNLNPVTFSWPPEDFVPSLQGYHEARCALALNPVTVSAVATRSGGRWRIEATCAVAVKYDDEAKVTLIPKTPLTPRLTIHERLFSVLQEVGWLHPYAAAWRFSIGSTDSRLK